MVEKRRTGPLNPLALALEKAGGSAQLVLDMYDLHRGQSDDPNYKGKESKPDTYDSTSVIQTQLKVILMDRQARGLIFDELSKKLIQRVEEAQKAKREQREDATILAFAHYALLASWIEKTAEGFGEPLSQEERSLLVALQKIIDTF